RIRQELFKLLAASGAVATLRIMARAGILRHVLPYTEEWRVLGRLPADPVLRVSVLAADPEGLRDRLRLSNREAQRIAALGATPPPTPGLRPAEQKAILYRLGPEAWADAVHLAWARSQAPRGDRGWQRLLNLPRRWTIPVFPVTGHDLLGRGMAAGPELGERLHRLEDWWIAMDFKPGKVEILGRLTAEGN
ncbi:MAG: CCA tRNA nucleotidyltransferase, partial [Alphaproteobacteria bacterium]|nr:CCA tRNA nucleotidyltransferase [Alphaproteobacteria bacterium]